MKTIALAVVGGVACAGSASAEALVSIGASDVANLKDTVLGLSATMLPVYLLIFAVSIMISYALGKRKGTK